MAEPKLKIPAKRVDSSDCVVSIGRKVVGGKIVDPGQPYPVHQGEWVELIPIRAVVQYSAWASFLESTGGEVVKVGRAFEQVTKEVASRIMAWNWTDLEGNPLPNPHNRPDIIEQLTEDELLWLMVAIGGESKAERKNASRPSPSTSSAEGQPLENPT